MAHVFGNNQILRFRSQIKAPINLYGRNAWHTVQIMEDLGFDFMLGDDLLDKLGLIMDYGTRAVGTSYNSGHFLRRAELVRLTMVIQDLHHSILASESADASS